MGGHSQTVNEHQITFRHPSMNNKQIHKERVLGRVDAYDEHIAYKKVDMSISQLGSMSIILAGENIKHQKEKKTTRKNVPGLKS